MAADVAFSEDNSTQSHVLSEDDSVSWETREAAGYLIESHKSGNTVKVSARGGIEPVRESLEQQIFGFTKSHRMAQHLAEALIKTTIQKTEQVGTKANNNYIAVSAVVADKFDSHTMCQFEESGYFEVTAITKDGASMAGIPDAVVQLGIGGTTMTSNKADVDAMFAGAKQWALFVVPEIGTINDIKGAEAEAIAAIGEMAASGADMGPGMPDNPTPEIIAEMIQSGEISSQTLDLVNANVQLAKLDAVAAHPSAPDSVQNHVNNTLDTISESIQAGIAEGTIPDGITNAIVDAMATNGHQATIDNMMVDAPAIAEVVQKGADNSNIAPTTADAAAPTQTANSPATPSTPDVVATQATQTANASAAPTQATPTQTAPTQVTPTQAAPTQATPTQAAPTQTAPTQAAPTQAAPTQAAPTQTAPTQATPTQAAPTQAAPTQTAPTQAAPTQAAPTQAAPTQAAPTQAAPTQAAPTQAAPTQAAPTQTAPTQAAPTQATPTQAAQTQAQPATATKPAANQPVANKPTQPAKPTVPTNTAPPAQPANPTAPPAQPPANNPITPTGGQPEAPTPQPQTQSDDTVQPIQQQEDFVQKPVEVDMRSSQEDISTQTVDFGADQQENTRMNFEVTCGTGCGCPKCSGGFNAAANNNEPIVAEANNENKQSFQSKCDGCAATNCAACKGSFTAAANPPSSAAPTVAVASTSFSPSYSHT